MERNDRLTSRPLLLYYDSTGKLPHAFVTLFPDLDESRDAIKKILEWTGADGH